jgi:rhodanese-related sulfurtransferase
VLAVQTVEMLREQGFKAIRLEEGIQDWRAMGLPVEIGG